MLLHLSDSIVKDKMEESYVAVEGFCGDHFSFPEGAFVKVLEKSTFGWWLVR